MEVAIDYVEVGRFWADVVRVCRFYNASVTGGPRTELRNARARGSSQTSKHTILYGWGMAADLVFDRPKDRDKFVSDYTDHPLYHIYIGSNYPSTRAHFQGWKYGEEPHRRL